MKTQLAALAVAGLAGFAGLGLLLSDEPAPTDPTAGPGATNGSSTGSQVPLVAQVKDDTPAPPKGACRTSEAG